MRVLDLRAILDEVFDGAQGPRGPVETIQFIHHNKWDVYRVTARDCHYIVHASADETVYLERLHRNLSQLAPLGDERVPQALAWRRSDGGPRWAVLVCQELAGEEMSTRNTTAAVLESLQDLLFRLHATPAAADSGQFSRRVDEVAGFRVFGERLLEKLADLPISRDRVRRHVEEMSRYLQKHDPSFDVTPRLIHGDLHRSNIVVSGARVGLLDWADLGPGDYAFDLASLKFVLDAVAPRHSAAAIRQQARRYIREIGDDSLELRMRFFLSLAGLVRAFHCAGDESAFRPSRAWRVRACYLHSEAQWRSPFRLEGPEPGAPVVRTEDFAVDMRQPLRGLFYLVAPKRVS